MPADQVIAAVSTEYVNVPVQATVNGQPFNPTGDPIAFAFVAGSAQPTAFTAGSWITTVQGNFVARCLVGPANGGLVLAPGIYNVWLKITDNPEVPIKPAGTLAIT